MRKKYRVVKTKGYEFLHHIEYRSFWFGWIKIPRSWGGKEEVIQMLKYLEKYKTLEPVVYETEF